jgi:beta-lactamase superfamily II metal-dependent hydrolase
VDPDDVFLVAKSGALWAYTGARSISYAKARAQADDTFLPYLKQAGVKWIVLSHLERAEEGRLLRLLERSCSALRLESYFPERTYLFRVVEPEFNEGEATACQAVQNYRVATADNDDGAGR